MVSNAVAGERKSLGAWAIVCLIPLVSTFAFVTREFGASMAAFLSLILALPTFIAVRFCRRWPAVTSLEIGFLALLFGVAVGSSIFVVRDWYGNRLDRDHAEDVRWNEFEHRLRRDPAFNSVEVHKSERKNVHWASGIVDSEADLARLRSLAAECGIEGRLDGPFAHSVSLTVEAR